MSDCETKSAKEPWQMSLDEFESNLLQADLIGEKTVTVVDWGSRRGQGKRSGSTVKGGMSNAPVGKKCYYGFKPGFPEWANLVKTSANPVLYAKARAIGLTHFEAGYVAINGIEAFHKKSVLEKLTTAQSAEKEPT